MSFSTKCIVTDTTVCVPDAAVQLIIIGIGNSLRRDDGAGIVLAAQLSDYFAASGFGTKLLTATQLLPEMAAEIAAAELTDTVMTDAKVQAIVFVDVMTAIMAGTPPDRFAIQRVDQDAPSAAFGHQLSPATLLLYASMLYGRAPMGWLVTIPGVDFAHGEGFSPRVTTALADSTSIARALHQKFQEANLCTSLPLPKS